jgi:hypothetical protein
VEKGVREGEGGIITSSSMGRFGAALEINALNERKKKSKRRHPTSLAFI